MAEQTEQDERTEEPTQHKLDEALKKGEIVYSPEVGAALSLFAVTFIVAFLSEPITSSFAGLFTAFIAAPHDFSVDPDSLRGMSASMVLQTFAILGLAMLALAAAGVAARYVQDRPSFSAARMEPKIDKLDPIKGFGRIFGRAAIANFWKGIAKLGVVGAAMAWALWPDDSAFAGLSLLDPGAFLPFVRERAVALLMALAFAAALIAAIDYAFARQSYMRKMRMSRREIRDELKQSEGDPQIKMRIRQIRTERARRRMIQAVPKATVVVTNPTHYAVALRYDEETPAPVCVAKGVDEVALRIREAAESHDVPVVEDPPLARALFAAADVEAPIPREHYEAVAKIIGFVMRLSQRRRGGRPANRRQ